MPFRKIHRLLPELRALPTFYLFFRGQTLLCYPASSDGYTIYLSGSDPDALGEIQDEYFAVADLPRTRALNDRLHGGLNKNIVDGDFQFRFFKQTARFSLSKPLPACNDYEPAAICNSITRAN